jgi:hypothetical protein
MALVYEGRRESLAGVEPRVAIKLILPSYANKDSFQELFINEARLGASLHHQNLVQIQDFDRDGDQFFLVMEYVEGLTLRRVIALCQRHQIRVPLGVVAEIGRQACDGLHYAHMAVDEQKRPLGLVHRDMKPSNLILNPQGVVKVLDFGISKGRLMRERKGAVRGTWGYMAPEQAHGEEVGPPADVFGLASVLYELAALGPLFVDKPQEEIRRLLLDDHPARMATQLDAEYHSLIGVLVRALQRDPAARYATAAEFGRALSAMLPDPISARDEVEKLYALLSALHEGRPPPSSEPKAGAPSAPTMDPAAVNNDGLPAGLLVGGVSAAVVAIVAVVILAAILAVQPWPEVSERAPIAAPAAADVAEPGSAAPIAPPPPPPEPAAEVRVDRTARAAPEPVVDDAPPPPPPAPVGPPGWVTLATQPAAEVYVDGQYLRTVPVVRYELTPGIHTITFVAPDGRTKTFDLEVTSDKEVRRLWDFDRAEFRR